MLSASLLLFAALLSLIVGTTVLARNYSKTENIAFFGISLGIVFWAVGIARFITTNNFAVAIAWVKLYYFAPLLIVFSSIIFAQKFLSITRLPKIINWSFGLAGLALALPLLVDKTFITSQIVERSYGKQVILDGRQYLVYSIYLLICFVFTIALTIRKTRTFKQGVVRQQAKVFILGYTISSILGVFFNLILPGFGNYEWIVLGPLFTTIFLFLVGYAIVRHKLFDIRLVVARTLGYASSLAVLASIYGFLVFGTAKIVFHVHLTVLTQIFLSATTGIAALFFARLRRFFDRTTNRIFYQDAYDPQALFDHLNRILISTLDLDKLLKQTSSLIADNLKADHCSIELLQDGKTRDPQLSIAMHELAKNFRGRVIVTDYLDDHEKLKSSLLRKNVAVAVRLSQHTKSDDSLGYLTLGVKRSGNIYTEQDVQVLDTIAKELIIAIQNAMRFEEIKHFNITLQQKIDEATRQLRRTNEKLKALDETKDDFISMASHQLRTPLTSVKGYISMVLEGDTGKIKPKQREMLGQAFFSSQRMVYLIADLLNVSRLKTGKFVIEPIPVNLADVVEQELSQLDETAAAHEIKLTYDKPKKFPDLMLDETKTRQVIMNFVDNAIYYTPAGGHINVKLIESPTTVELRVEDNGIGVPASEKPHLFTKFYRAGNARKARPDGTGLGLFMAKKVIVAQGGSIVFQSQEGKGSTFGFIFSKAKHAVPAKPLPQPAKPPPKAAKTKEPAAAAKA